MLLPGAIHAVDVVGALTVACRRWLSVGLWDDGFCSERRGGGEGWKQLELCWLWGRRPQIRAKAQGLLRRGVISVLLIEARLGWLDV